MSDVDPTLEDMACAIAVCREEIRQLRTQYSTLSNQIIAAENRKRVVVQQFDARVALVKR